MAARLVAQTISPALTRGWPITSARRDVLSADSGVLRPANGASTTTLAGSYDWPNAFVSIGFARAACSVGVVVASLSLHYFAWLDTLALVDRVRDTLSSRGVLLSRLNSTNDHNYGASGHPRIAENFYSVDGELKRFFDRESLNSLFADGWRPLIVEETVIHRYDQPKFVWEMVLERDA